MSKEEYEELKPGDHVWCFIISFNIGSFRGSLGQGYIAELEKQERENEFKVIQVKKGTKAGVGNILTCGTWGIIPHEKLFKEWNEGVDYWNGVVHNEVDRLTSNYEEATKRVTRNILKRKES